MLGIMVALLINCIYLANTLDLISMKVTVHWTLSEQYDTILEIYSCMLARLLALWPDMFTIHMTIVICTEPCHHLPTAKESHDSFLWNSKLSVNVIYGAIHSGPLPLIPLHLKTKNDFSCSWNTPSMLQYLIYASGAILYLLIGICLQV